MAAAKYDIIVEQHQDFARGFSLTTGGLAVDLTDHTFTAQLRIRESSTEAYDFNVEVVDALQGLINMTMGDDTTSTIKSGYYFYDLVMTTPAGDKIRILEGEAKVDAGVTR